MVLAQQTVIIDCLLDWRSKFFFFFSSFFSLSFLVSRLFFSLCVCFPLQDLLLSFSVFIVSFRDANGSLSISGFGCGCVLRNCTPQSVGEQQRKKEQTKKDAVLCQTLTERSV